jgi:transporter family-2 protein
MNGRTIFLLAALAGGAVLPVQVALNTLLRRYVGEPMQVTFISYLAGAIASLVVCFIAQYPLPITALFAPNAFAPSHREVAAQE